MTDIFKIKFFKLYKIRLPWLALGLIGGMMAAGLVGQFEEILRREIALSFFIPVVVYISNAISIQAQALLIRTLASQKVKVALFLKRELLVSLSLAITSALAISAFAGIWLGSAKVALTVGLAVIASTVVAVTIATAVPLVLYFNRKDPALGSGPFATAIQDVTTLLIYFLIAGLIIF